MLNVWVTILENGCHGQLGNEMRGKEKDLDVLTDGRECLRPMAMDLEDRQTEHDYLPEDSPWRSQDITEDEKKQEQQNLGKRTRPHDQRAFQPQRNMSETTNMDATKLTTSTDQKRLIEAWGEKKEGKKNEGIHKPNGGRKVRE